VETTGVDLAIIIYTVNSSGALYDPTPLPTIAWVRGADGTVISPPALSHDAVGTFSAVVIAAAANMVSGTASMMATTTDASDGQGGLYPFHWDVSQNYLASIVAAIFAFPKASVAAANSWAKYVMDTLASIVAKTNLIGTGVLFTSLPVGPDGRTQVIKGSTYKTVYGLALVYEFDGYPAFPLDGSCTWFATARYSSTPFSKAGTIDTATKVHFELSYTEAAALARGYCAIEIALAAGDPIRTPNLPLDVLDSLGA
jgi:hypothetical protein